MVSWQGDLWLHPADPFLCAVPGCQEVNLAKKAGINQPTLPGHLPSLGAAAFLAVTVPILENVFVFLLSP